MKPRKLSADEVTFTIEIEPDDLDLRGNVMASGDDAFDKQCEDELIERLERGDTEAWCRVKVTAEWRGHEGYDYLGGCSLDSTYTAEIVATEHGMREQALDDLNQTIAASYDKIAPLLDGGQ